MILLAISSYFTIRKIYVLSFIIAKLPEEKNKSFLYDRKITGLPLPRTVDYS